MHPLLQHDLEHLPEILRQACDTALTHLNALPMLPACAPSVYQQL